MNQKNQGNAIGISLILVVFILLCLITFGTLSYMLAKMDNELSLSTAQNTTEYYTADMAAKATLQQLDEQMALVYTSVATQYDFTLALQASFAGVEGDVFLSVADDARWWVTYTTPVNDTEVLRTTLKLAYFTADGSIESETGGYYKIVAWQLEPISAD